MGSFEESPPEKCLEHTHDWHFSWLSSILKSCSNQALLV